MLYTHVYIHIYNTYIYIYTHIYRYIDFITVACVAHVQLIANRKGRMQSSEGETPVFLGIAVDLHLYFTNMFIYLYTYIYKYVYSSNSVALHLAAHGHKCGK